MVKLKSSHQWRAGRSVTLAVAGLVTFDSEGIIEVEEKIAEQLVAIYPDLSEEKEAEEIKKKSEEGKELNPSLEPDIPHQIEDSSNSPVELEESSETTDETIKKEDLVVKLSEYTLAELKEYAKEYPKELTKDLRLKQEFVEFLATELSK